MNNSNVQNNGVASVAKELRQELKYALPLVTRRQLGLLRSSVQQMRDSLGHVSVDISADAEDQAAFGLLVVMAEVDNLYNLLLLGEEVANQ